MRKRELKGSLAVVHKSDRTAAVGGKRMDENVSPSLEWSREKKIEAPTDEEAGDIFDNLMQLQS